MPHYIFLSPGMFGFTRLASLGYFSHVAYHDWLASGSQFNDASFESLMDAIATGMLNSAQSKGAER